MAEEKTVREKNQEAAKKQAEAVSQQKNKQIMEFNEKFEGLTKRNQDYMFHLNKALAEKNYAEREKVVSEMYNELMEKQKQFLLVLRKNLRCLLYGNYHLIMD